VPRRPVHKPHFLEQPRSKIGEISNATKVINFARGATGAPNVRDSFGPSGKAIFSEWSCTYPCSNDYRLTHHWDGNALLFTTDSNGAVQDVKFDTIGNVTPQTGYNAITLWDRDFSGITVSMHNASGAGPWGAIDSASQCVSGIYATAQSGFNVGGPCSSSGAIPSLLHFTRLDGYTDGFRAIQGVRSYDMKLGQWTTMDDYTANDMDPMSGQSYVWNRDNPLAFMDPSGYCGVLITTSGNGSWSHFWPCPQPGASPGGGGATEVRALIKPVAGPLQTTVRPKPRSTNLPLTKCSAVANSEKRGESFDKLGDVITESTAEALENPETVNGISQTIFKGKGFNTGPIAGYLAGSAQVVRSLQLGDQLFSAAKANTLATCLRMEMQQTNPLYNLIVAP